jgi:hypothetical protein
MSNKHTATLIKEWHDADKGLWCATPEGFDAALSRFCAATDAVVADCDRTGRTVLAGPVADYKEELLTVMRQSVGTITLRDLYSKALPARGQCLGALNRLTWLAEAAEHGPGDTLGGRAKPSKEATAIALLIEHPDWSNQQIAEAVGCNVKYLSQAKKFRAARAAVRGIGQESLRRSGKYRGNDMDAHDDQEG